MPALSISQLPAGIALTGAELLPAVQDGATVHTSVAMLRAGLATAEHIHTNDDVEDLSETLAATRRIGRRTIWLPAGTMSAPSTGGAAPGVLETAINGQIFPVLDFDPDMAESAQAIVALPKAWNGGAFAFQLLWTADGTGDVVWTVAASGLTAGSALDAAPGAAVPVTASLADAGMLQGTAEAGPLAPAGTAWPDGLVALRIVRSAGDLADTLSTDARLIGLRLFYAVDATSDD